MSAMQGIELVREELESHWLPFTDNKSFKDDPRLFIKGEGVYLWNQHGDRLLDGTRPVGARPDRSWAVVSGGGSRRQQPTP